jgi:hypothetical protein
MGRPGTGDSEVRIVAQNPNLYFPSLRLPEGVIMGRQNFWLAAVVGALVMFLLFFIPVAGPLFGGFVAGLIARGNPQNGAKAGFVAGIVGGILAATILIVGFPGMSGIFNRALAEFVIRAGFDIKMSIIPIALYHALLGLMGGAVGAALVKG